MNVRIIVQPDNPGNADTRSAFLKRGDEYLYGVEQLADVCRVKGSRAYKMCEPIGEFGSGMPSIAALHNEVLRRRVEMDKRERRETSLALELAFGSVRFVRGLLTGTRASIDLPRRLLSIGRRAAQIGFEADGRQLPEMSINDLEAARFNLRALLTEAEEVLLMVDAQIQAAATSFNGVPQMRDRKAG